jgi:hypothetical protein
MNCTVGFIPWLLLGLMMQLCRCMTVPTPISVSPCNPELRDMLQKFPLGEFFRSGTQHLLFLAEHNSQILYRISIYYSAGSDSNQTFCSFSTDQFQNLGNFFHENSCERKLFQAVANGADVDALLRFGWYSNETYDILSTFLANVLFQRTKGAKKELASKLDMKAPIINLDAREFRAIDCEGTGEHGIFRF